MNMNIYVGTYSKYNDGNLAGKWLALDQYNNRQEFYSACAELHNDEDDPEFMFQDYEGIPDGFISECMVADEVWEMIEAFKGHDEDAIIAFTEWRGEWSLTAFEDCYQGKYNSEIDFTYELIDSNGQLNEMPAHLHYYFDYQKYSDELFQGDFHFTDGHVFFNN